MNKQNKKGFTIVELVIVIAVIAILAAVLIPTFSGIVEKANASSAQQEASNSLKIVLAELAENGEDLKNATFLYVDGNKVVYTIAYTNNQLASAVKTTSPNKFTVTNDYNVYCKATLDATAIGKYFINENSKTLTQKKNADISKNIIILVEAPDVVTPAT